MSGEGDAGPSTLIVAIIYLLVGNMIRFLLKYYRINVPYSVCLMAVSVIWGVLMSTCMRKYLPDNHPTYLVKDMDPHLFLIIFIPPLLFESAFAINYHTFRRSLFQSVFLAIPGMVVGALITAVLFMGLFPFYGWTFAEAVAFGAMVGATDPVAVVALLRDVGASPKLSTLIESESLLNDGSAFVLWQICLKFVLHEEVSFGMIVGLFSRLSILGCIWGIALGWVFGTWLSYVHEDMLLETTLTVAGAFITYWTAQQLVVSDILAVVMFALYLSKNRVVISPKCLHGLHEIWEWLAYVANTLIFSHVGIYLGYSIAERSSSSATILRDISTNFALWIILHFVRFFVIGLSYPILKITGYGFSWSDCCIMVFGGLRGAIGLGIAMLTVLQLRSFVHTHHETEEYGRLEGVGVDMLFHTCGIVFWTLLVNASIMPYIVSWLNIDKLTEEGQVIFHQVVEHIRHEEILLIKSMKADPVYTATNWATLNKTIPDYSVLKKKVFRQPKEQTRRKTKFTSIFAGVKRGVKSIFEKREGARVSTTISRSFKIKQNSFEGRNSESLNGEWDNQYIDDDSEDTESISNREVKSRIYTVGLRDSTTSDEKEVRVSNSARKSVFQRQTERLSSDKNGRGKGMYDRKKSKALSSYINLCTGDNLKNEVRQRMLATVKASIWKQFHDGMISEEATRILDQSIDVAFDENDLQAAWDFLNGFIKISDWTNYFFQLKIPILNTIFHQHISSKLRIAIEICEAFIFSFQNVDYMLEIFPEFAKLQCTKQVLAKANDLEKVAKAASLEIKISYSDIYKSIKTYQAANYLLNQDLKIVNELNKTGVMEEKEYKRIKQFVKANMREAHKIQRKFQFHNKGNLAQEMFAQLPWFSHLDDDLSKELFKQCELRNFHKGQFLHHEGDKIEDLGIIISGIVEFRFGAHDILEHRETGQSIGLYSIIGHQNAYCNAVARTETLILYVTAEIIVEMMEYKLIYANLIKSCAEEMLQRFFREHFHHLTTTDLNIRVQTGTVISFSKTDILADLKNEALLLRGSVNQIHASAVVNDELIDNSKKKSMKRKSSRQQRMIQIHAPSILLPSTDVYMVEIDSLIVVLGAHINPNEHHHHQHEDCPQQVENIEDDSEADKLEGNQGIVDGLCEGMDQLLARGGRINFRPPSMDILSTGMNDHMTEAEFKNKRKINRKAKAISIKNTLSKLSQPRCTILLPDSKSLLSRLSTVQIGNSICPRRSTHLPRTADGNKGRTAASQLPEIMEESEEENNKIEVMEHVKQELP